MKKKCFSTSFILLTVSVMGAVLNNEIYEVGIEDGAAVIKCHYSASHQPYTKYFCKGIQKDCKTLIKTDDQNPWTFEGRLSLFDNTEISMFVVNINNLSLGDHGQYGCGVNITGQGLFTVVHLTVRKNSSFTTKERPMSTVTSRQGNAPDSTGSSSQPTVSSSLSAIPIVLSGGMRVNGTLGGNAYFRCSYHKGSKINPKYFSKDKPGKEFVRLDRGVMWSRDSRFFLEDDMENNVFTVTIRNLSLVDAGLYWCGVDMWLLDFLTEFKLHIVQDVPTEDGEN
ncbi:hypothetical protein AMELA_G00234970 [Ameiurus melas]|uniref:Immunoglobulin domain-containing protein n=1 Tax=Ameiurus melas TaxID=219545 RepID=A0A7J5ZXY1_AMEME|nr:hypothetical protein AMELA_G00234970 [Ameiurus melas]